MQIVLGANRSLKATWNNLEKSLRFHIVLAEAQCIMHADENETKKRKGTKMKTKLPPGDMRVVAESELRAEEKIEREAAKALSSAIAAELGIDQLKAASQYRCLERPVLTPDWTELELPGLHCWTPEARRQQFVAKCR